MRQGLALVPQGDEIFHGLTVEEHLDSGAFTPKAWRERGMRKERILEIFPPLKALMTTAGRSAFRRRAAHGGARPRPDGGRLALSRGRAFPRLAPKIGKGVIDALMGVELGKAAMVIAEQNVAVLEGRVDRVIGMHAGKLKGEAAASLSYQTRRDH